MESAGLVPLSLNVVPPLVVAGAVIGNADAKLQNNEVRVSKFLKQRS